MTARHIRTVATDPSTLTIDDCTCLRDCNRGRHQADKPCELSGRLHTHPEDVTGDLGPCPMHRDVPMAAAL